MKKNYTVNLDPKLWARFKKTARIEGRYINAIIADLIEKYIKEEKAK